jgi:MFS family permease
MVVALVFSIGALVEGGVGTWGVLFLREHLGLAVAAGAGAYVVGQALATTARSTLGWTAEHVGQRRGAQLGLGLAGIGLLLEAASGSGGPAAVGLGMAAVGSAVYWPLLLAFASGGGERPGLVVGGLSAAGYVGFLAGPPVVGWIAQATSLRWGLALLGVAALAGACARLRPRVYAPNTSSSLNPPQFGNS